MNKRKSLKLFLIKNLIIAVVVPVLILGIGINAYLSNKFHQEVMNNMILASESTGNEINQLLDQYEEVIKTIGSIIDNEIIDENHIQEYLKVSIENYQLFEEIGILDKKGIIQYIEPYRKDFIGLDMSKRKYFKAGKDVYWSDVFVSAYSGEAAINISVKLNHYTIVGYINLAKLEELLDRISRENRESTIIDKTGSIIVTTNNGVSHLNEKLKYSVNHEINGLNMTPFYEKTDDDGNKILFTRYHVDKTGWTVEISALEKEIMKPFSTAGKIFFSGMLITFVILFFLMKLLLNKIIIPLNMLTDTTKTMAQGDYDIDFKQEDSFDEIMDLAENFKNMADKIKERDEELKQFVYIASHDLQEPLRMVTSYLQIIEKKYKGKLDENGDKYIFFAVDGAKRMKALIEDLLVYSRAGGDYEFNENVDMNGVLEEAKRNLQLDIKENHAKITHEKLPVVKGDKIKLIQLFQNLLSNSIKYRKDINPEIHIKAIEKEKFWEIQIRDNGIGMEEEHLSSIFQVFKRLHTREKYSGTGIGLAICKKIITKHGGEIYAKSKINEGTTFYFTLSKGE